MRTSSLLVIALSMLIVLLQSLQVDSSCLLDLFGAFTSNKAACLSLGEPCKSTDKCCSGSSCQYTYFRKKYAHFCTTCVKSSLDHGRCPQPNGEAQFPCCDKGKTCRRATNKSFYCFRLKPGAAPPKKTQSSTVAAPSPPTKERCYHEECRNQSPKQPHKCCGGKECTPNPCDPDVHAATPDQCPKPTCKPPSKKRPPQCYSKGCRPVSSKQPIKCCGGKECTPHPCDPDVHAATPEKCPKPTCQPPSKKR